ncbi:MAG: anhydro-N-acetylmuramic acid kinase [Calditrichota bacterium]
MTGTSMDALDVALCRIEGIGLNLRATLVEASSWPLRDLSVFFRRASEQLPVTARDLARASHDLAMLHLEALQEISRGRRLDLICVHGQTIYHAPPLSWQLIQPTLIAHNLNVPVVYDLRAADLARGGQGAPITPLADFILFRKEGERRCIINLGGFCNHTLIPGRSGAAPGQDELLHWKLRVSGGDICSCNHLLDRIARDLLGRPYDAEGSAAAGGKTLKEPLEELTKLLLNQSVGKRSLGTGDELGDWINKYRHEYAPQDLARIACAAIASVITRPVPAERLILAGGGTKNITLLKEIRSRSKKLVSSSDEFDIPPLSREAMAMAVLGALCQDRIPITLGQVTGSFNPPVAGTWIIP